MGKQDKPTPKAMVKGVPVYAAEDAAKLQEEKVPSPSANSVAYEEHARKRAHIEQVADEISAATSMTAIDPKKLGVNPDILRKLGHGRGFKVTNPQPGYRYACGRYRPDTRDVEAKKALGYEVVMDDDPENKDIAERYDPVTGTAIGRRIIGDVILMRVPLERWKEIQRADQYIRWKNQVAVGLNVQEEASKVGAKLKGLSQRDQRRFLNRKLARNLAREKLHDQVMAGIVPGLPVSEAVMAADARGMSETGL